MLVCLKEERWLCRFVVVNVSNLILDSVYDFSNIVNIYISFYFLLKLVLKNVFSLGKLIMSGADPAFVIRGGPNSEIFLTDFRKSLKAG